MRIRLGDCCSWLVANHRAWTLRSHVLFPRGAAQPRPTSSRWQHTGACCLAVEAGAMHTPQVPCTHRKCHSHTASACTPQVHATLMEMGEAGACTHRKFLPPPCMKAQRRPLPSTPRLSNSPATPQSPPSEHLKQALHDVDHFVHLGMAPDAGAAARLDCMHVRVFITRASRGMTSMMKTATRVSAPKPFNLPSRKSECGTAAAASALGTSSLSGDRACCLPL